MWPKMWPKTAKMWPKQAKHGLFQVEAKGRAAAVTDCRPITYWYALQDSNLEPSD